MSALIIIRGLPGSGKSHIATAMQDMLGAGNVVILDPDYIDKTSQAYIDLSAKLAAEGVDAKFFPNRFLKQRGYEAIDDGKTLVWTQAFTDLYGLSRSIRSLEDYARSQGTALPVLVVEVTIDPAIARDRATAREQQGGHGVPPEAFADFMNRYESFAGKLPYAHLNVDGNGDVSTSVAAILEALSDVGQASLLFQGA